jgi:small conductance mechanosensitive channel
VLALAFAVLSAGPALAQTAGQPAQQPADPAAKSGQSSAAALDTKELKGLIDTLKDDQARAKFVEQLEALLKARQSVKTESPGAEAVTWLSTLSDRLKETAGSVFAVGGAVADLPKLLDNLAAGIQDAPTRARWMAIVFHIAVILVAGYAAYYVLGLILLKPRHMIEERRQRSVLRRGLLSFLRAILELLALGAFGGAALAAAAFTGPEPSIRLAALALVNAKLAAGAVMIGARFLLSPKVRNLRLLPVRDETAQYLFIWCGRVVYVAIYGYFLLEALRLIGLSMAIHGFLLDVLGLAVAILLIILILQNREAVARSLRARAEGKRPFAAIRRPLAATWHWLAIFYVAALYLVIAVHGNGGTTYIVQGTVLTAIILIFAWALENAAHRGIHRGLRITDDLRRTLPGLERRLNRYTVALDYALRIVVYAVAAIAIFEAWGVEAFAWIVSSTGERVISSIANIVLISVLAVVVWEVASSLIERQLSNSSQGASPSTRARTLLPLAQTALKIVLVVLVVMVVLAEIGVNITPLLAGAGVVGLAVGFGAQKLVQDVITGWFILMEDTIAVGDVAEVAGHAGLVERINIRTIRLRDLSGVVHTIPFSTVDAVKNFTKDFSYYLFEVGVAYREDTDEVVAVLRALDEEMRNDPDYGPDILEPLEVMGVDRFEDSAVIVRVRTKTRPLRQWAIGREFNRRMKKVFDEKGIEIPFPHRTIYFGVAKDDTAPPAHLRIDQATSRAFAEAQETLDPKAEPAISDTVREKAIAEDDAPGGDGPH